MAIQVVGILLDPLQNPSVGTTIRMTAQDNVSTLKGMVATTKTGELGGYDFQLGEGTFEMEINFSDEYSLVQEVEVDHSTPTPITLIQLLQLP